VAGAWAGAAAGAAIGSVVPVIGTAIGGAIGMALGGLGGDALGGWLGKKLFGEEKAPEVADMQPEAKETPKAERPAIGAAVVAKAPAVAEADKPDAISVTTKGPKAEPPTIGAAVAATAPAVPEAVKLDTAPHTAPGAVVRELVKTAPPPPPLQEVAKAAAPSKPTAKVDQAFNYSPSSSIVVHGDVKDPAQLARELEPYNRQQFEQFMREVSGRQATKLLYDDPHL